MSSFKKAEAIREDIGVSVPMPEDNFRINQALIKATLMKHERKNQNTNQATLFDFVEAEEILSPFDVGRKNACEKAKGHPWLAMFFRLDFP